MIDENEKTENASETIEQNNEPCSIPSNRKPENEPQFLEVPERKLVHDWQYSDVNFPNSIFRVYDNGETESTSELSEEVIAWKAAGNKILPAPAPAEG